MSLWALYVSKWCLLGWACVFVSLWILLLTEMEWEDKGERLSEAFPIRVPLKLMRGTDVDTTLGLLSRIVRKEMVIMH